MREYGFTLTELEPERPWIVVGIEHSSVTLEDEANFFDWVAENWPSPRWAVQLDPWALTSKRAN